MADTTEKLRGMLVDVVNAVPRERESLEKIHGKNDVWDTKELQENFEVMGFAAPLLYGKKEKYRRGGCCHVSAHAEILFQVCAS